MKHSLNVLALAGTLAILLTPTAQAISFEDVERIDKQEQSELLERARQAARSWDFPAAQRYLGQARNKGYAPKDIKAVETLIAQNQSAKAADDERKRREEAERQQRALATQQASPSRASGGGGGNVDSVMVKFECVGGLWGCTWKNLAISGGPGNFNPSFNGAPSGHILKGYNGLAGQYSYSVTLEQRVCSGSFMASGRSRGMIINVHHDCHLGGVFEY